MDRVYSDKAKARAELIEARRAISSDLAMLQSRLLCERLMATDEIKQADTVLLFSSTRNEPDLTYLAEHLLSCGVRVAYPISHKSSCTLTFHTVSSLGELTPAAFNIPEPPADAPMPSLGASAVCIVPALAYDKEGYRIGYGKGFYDRFLRDFTGVSVGVAYDGFVLDSLPREEHDVPLDIIITTTGAIKTK